VLEQGTLAHVAVSNTSVEKIINSLSMQIRVIQYNVAALNHILMLHLSEPSKSN
jgi:hypothetical protein